MRGHSDHSNQDARPEGQSAEDITREADEERAQDAVNAAERKAAEDAVNLALSRPDITVANHISLIILTGVSVRGAEWLASHLDPDAQRWGRDGYVVEPRYVDDILAGASDDGLDVAP